MTLEQTRLTRARLSVPSRTLQHLPGLALFLDAAVIVVVCGLAAMLRRTWDLFPMGADVSSSLTVAGPLMVVVWLATIAVQGGYTRSVFEVGTDEFRRVAMGSLVSAGLVGAGCYLFKFQLARGFFFLLFVIGTPTLLIGRYLLRTLVAQARQRGALQHNVLIAGSAYSVDEVALVLRREQRLGYRVQGALVPDDELHLEETPAGIPVVGSTAHVTETALATGVDVLFLASGSLTSTEQMQSIAWELEHHDVQVVVAPSVGGVSGDRVRIRPVGGLPLMHIDRPRGAKASAWSKRLFDIVASASLLVAFSPLMAWAALRVKLHDSGPVLFRQIRTGRDGGEFACLKFRSMVTDAEALLAKLHAEAGFEQGLFKMKDDPRITAPGKWLRRFSIDELPQLINVIRGDMSLIGPRPPLPAEVATYTEQARRRLRVRPGLTGLWQVSGRSELSFDEAIRLDLYYVDNWSIFQDVSILLKTVGAVFASRGAY